MAFVSLLCLCGFANAGSLILIFCGLLRVGEGLGSKIEDLVFTNVQGAPMVVILIRRSKQGVPSSEKVVHSSPRVIEFLRLFLVRSGRAPHEPLCQTSYGILQRRLAKAESTLGFNVGFRSHNVRRGGARALAMHGLPFADIMAAGRWSSERSAKFYIQKGEVLVLGLRANLSVSQQSKIRLLAIFGENFFGLMTELEIA